MKRVKVEIPFHMIATDTDHVLGDVIEVSEEQLARIRAVNVNMVSVLADVEEEPVQEETTEETVEEEPVQPKKRKPKKPKEQ